MKTKQLNINSLEEFKSNIPPKSRVATLESEINLWEELAEDNGIKGNEKLDLSLYDIAKCYTTIKEIELNELLDTEEFFVIDGTEGYNIIKITDKELITKLQELIENEEI